MNEQSGGPASAVILAAGRGTRLKSVTGDMPKPLLDLNGRAMIEWVVDSLRMAGFGRFLMVVGYRHELFYARFAADKTVHFKLQDPVDGTGSAARLAEEFAGEEPVLLMFGDILAAPEDLRGLYERLLADARAEAVLGVKWVEDPHQGAAVYEEAGVVGRIVEKPPVGTSTTHWNSAGVYAFRKGMFEELRAIGKSPRGEYELTSAIVALLEKGRRVLMHELVGEWRDVGRPEDVAAASELTARR